MKAEKILLARYLIVVQPPQPPTAPAPAVRPTPPTPPRIDKAPLAKPDEKISPPDEKPVNESADKPAEKINTPVEKPVEKPAPPNQTVTVIPPDAPVINEGQSDYDRGQDVLRQFRDLDAATNEPQTSTEQRPVVPKITQSDGHGTFYWLFTIIFVGIAAFVIVKKFLITDKPALTKSELFADTSAKLKAASEKVKPPTPPPKSDDKGKHFEVRV